MIQTDLTPRATRSGQQAQLGFSFREIGSAAERQAFEDMLIGQYEALGFFDAARERAGFMPRAGTRLFGLWDGGTLAAICALNPVEDAEASFYDYVPVLRDHPDAAAMELNNIVVAKGYRGSVAFHMLLHRAVMWAIDHGALCVCGIVRFEVLKHFIRAGAIPVDHPPLRVLDHRDYEDFVIYFDCSTASSLDYLEEHARRLMYQEAIFSRISNRRRAQRRRAPVH